MWHFNVITTKLLLGGYTFKRKIHFAPKIAIPHLRNSVLRFCQFPYFAMFILLMIHFLLIFSKNVAFCKIFVFQCNRFLCNITCVNYLLRMMWNNAKYCPKVVPLHPQILCKSKQKQLWGKKSKFAKKKYSIPRKPWPMPFRVKFCILQSLKQSSSGPLYKYFYTKTTHYLKKTFFFLIIINLIILPNLFSAIQNKKKVTGHLLYLVFYLENI